MLTIYIDFKSAASYLAIESTLDLAARHHLELDWRPFRTIERDVPQLGQEETVGESHRRVRAESQRTLAIKYASYRGIDLKFPQTVGSSDLALGVLAGVEGDRLTFIRAAFASYWEEHADLDDPDTVKRILASSKANYQRDLAGARDDLALAQDSAEEFGIVGTPAYVIKDQIFVGREHLPWIESLVRGDD